MTAGPSPRQDPRETIVDRRQLIAGATAVAGLAAVGRASADPVARLPKAVVVGVGPNGRSRIAYERIMPERDRSSPAAPLLAWDTTPQAPNDGAYAAASSERRGLWAFKDLFPTGSGIRILYSTIAPGQSFDLHATPSIDVVFVLSGRIVMEVDDGEVSLSAGDVVVQNATSHNWRVSGDDGPCRLGAIVLAPDFGVRG